MKKKQIISILIIGIFGVGCTQQPSKEVQKADLSAKNEDTKAIETNYRQRLQLLNSFKKKVPMPFTNNDGKKDGNCPKDFNTSNQICLDRLEDKIIEKNSCEDAIGLKQLTIYRTTIENNQTQETTYACANSIKTTKETIQKHKIYKDKRYISVDDIINKSGKDKLPTNLDLIVKNTINTIGKNYILIDVTDSPRDNEYRIEGAITGFDETYVKSNSHDKNVYGTTSKKEFNTELASEKGTSVAELSMEFILKKYNGDLHRWEYVRNVSTSRKAILLKKETGYSFTFALLGGGFNFSDNENFSNGVYHISKYLIESSMVELLARLDDLPYWSFLPTSTNYTDTEKNWRNELILTYASKLNYRNIKDYKALGEYYANHFIKNLLNIYDEEKKPLSQKILDYKKHYYKDFSGTLNNKKVDETLIVHLLEHTPDILLQSINRKSQKAKPRINGFEPYTRKD